jgi:hypothetical protein
MDPARWYLLSGWASEKKTFVVDPAREEKSVLGDPVSSVVCWWDQSSQVHRGTDVLRVRTGVRVELSNSRPCRLDHSTYGLRYVCPLKRGAHFICSQSL